MSPDGSRVFVTGSRGSGAAQDYATVAFDAVGGMWAWYRTYDGPGNAEDAATGIAVSPDGSRLFVTGGSTGSATSAGYCTIAYNAT